MKSKGDKPFSFKAQLAVGTRGEELFLDNYPTKLEIHPDRDGDFICTETGRKIELKTDTYNIEKTDNFFIERWSSVYSEPKKPGGVWQAVGHGCEIFCYYFVRHNIWFQFEDLEALCGRLNELTEGKGLVYIKNNGWTTAGYKVKRSDLADLYKEYKF